MRLAVASVVVDENDGDVNPAAATTTARPVLVAALHPDPGTGAGAAIGDGDLPVVGDAVAGRIARGMGPMVRRRRMAMVAPALIVVPGGHDSDLGGWGGCWQSFEIEE